MIFPGIVNEIRGTLGVKIYSKNTFGPYVRDWAPVMQVDTSLQLPLRQALSDAVSAWRLLPDPIKQIYAYRAELNKYKNSLGVLRSVSGYNFFIRHYMLKYKAGLLPDNTLPTLNSSSRFVLSSLELTENDIRVTVDHKNNNSIGSQYSYFTLVASPGLSTLINFPARQFMRVLNTYSFPDLTSNFSIRSAWENLYGNWQDSGQLKIFVGIQTFNIGQNSKSNYLYLSGINPNPIQAVGFPYVFDFNLS